MKNSIVNEVEQFASLIALFKLFYHLI